MRGQGAGARGRGSRVKGPGPREVCALAVALLLGLCCGCIRAQTISLGDDRPVSHRQHVEFLSDAITVDAGRPQEIELRFRVDPGFHINSHHPKDELLIATALRLDASAVKVLDERYPAGAAFRLSNSPEPLDVYQNEFRVSLRVIAPRGVTQLNGTLRYQACDNAACFPPRELPVRIALTAK